MTKGIKHFYEFGPFRIDLEERVLLRGLEPIPLPPKAFETLLILVNRSERVVLKDDLMKSLWPDTFVEEANLSQNIFVLRKALGESAQEARYIATVPGRGYRFAQKVREIPGEEALVVETQSIRQVTVEESKSGGVREAVAALRSEVWKRRWSWALAGAASLVVATFAALVILRPGNRSPMGEEDLILVTDFVNTTGEPVFDGSLKQALTVKLAESPYFNLALDRATRQTLKLMDRSSDERVVPPLAREVCQREGAKVMVTGAIVHLGDKYLVDLDAMNCLTGASLAHEQIDALNKDQVLNRLGQAVPRLRRKLGESVSSIQKFDTPIEQATTQSLAALKAYTTGDELRSQGKDEESIQFYKLAIDLDPEFAIAYARLGAIYTNLQQPTLADQYMQKAYERRGHVTEREKFYIAAHSSQETEKAIENYKLWAQVYPRDWIPFNNLSNDYNRIGEMEKAVEAGQQALRLNPNHGFPYNALARAYQRSSRFAEAKAICEKAEARKLDGWTTHEILWSLALLESNESEMQRQVDWYKGNPMECWLLHQQATAWLSFGQVRKSRAAFGRARTLAIQRDMKEFAADIDADEGQFEAELGNPQQTRAMVAEALRLAPNAVDVKSTAAIALARAGDAHRAEGLVSELNPRGNLGKRYKDVLLACAGAALALDRRNPSAAVEQLQYVIPYDLATSNDGLSLYYRGLAYLEQKNGREAATQFHRIVDNRGVCWFYWPLAHLGLARAWALTGDTDKSLAMYRRFLELWNSADPDLRLLKEARIEYSQLSSHSPQ